MVRGCLDALKAHMPSQASVEIIVVVDGSNDGTVEMLDTYDVSVPMRVIWQENAGQAAALNRGIDAAAGRICLFLDDDILAGPNLVEEHLNMQSSGVIGLGRLSISVPHDADGLVRQYADWWNNHYSRLDNGRLPRVTDCFSGNLSVPRDALRAVGGIADDLPRLFDIELGYRLCRHGLRLVYSPRAGALQDFRKEARSVLADARAEGAGEVEVYRRHPPLLPDLRLGAFCTEPLIAMVLHRILLRVRLPLPAATQIGGTMARIRWAASWNRFLYAYWFWRGVKEAIEDDNLWGRVTSGTTILMYHAFGAPDEGPSRYVLSGTRFARHMAWLRRMHYQVLSLDQYLACRDTYTFPPARSVVITVDDGYTDVRTIAYPLAKRHGLHLTVFVVTGLVGKTNTWDGEGDVADRPLLGDTDLREMDSASVSFGAHSRTHPVLPTLEAEGAWDEIAGSRGDLTALLGHPPLSFAYPYGETNDEIQSLVRAAGYAGAVTVRGGLNGPSTPQFALHRTEMRGTDSIVRLLLALWTGRAELRRRA